MSCTETRERNVKTGDLKRKLNEDGAPSTSATPIDKSAPDTNTTVTECNDVLNETAKLPRLETAT